MGIRGHYWYRRKAGKSSLILPYNMEHSVSQREQDIAGNKEKKIQRSGFTSIIILFCTLTTRLFGLVRNAVINAIFGGSGHADVWHLVFMIPNNFRKLFAEGALSSAFIPVLSSSIVEDPRGESAKVITRNIISFQLIILLPLNVCALIFARP